MSFKSQVSGFQNKKFRDTMPKNWDWKTGDPFIRYKEGGIFDELDF